MPPNCQSFDPQLNRYALDRGRPETDNCSKQSQLRSSKGNYGLAAVAEYSALFDLLLKWPTVWMQDYESQSTSAHPGYRIGQRLLTLVCTLPQLEGRVARRPLSKKANYRGL